jgi:hypothetical protein
LPDKPRGHAGKPAPAGLEAISHRAVAAAEPAQHLSENFTAPIPVLPSSACHEFHDSFPPIPKKRSIFIPAVILKCSAAKPFSWLTAFHI